MSVVAHARQVLGEESGLAVRYSGDAQRLTIAWGFDDLESGVASIRAAVRALAALAPTQTTSRTPCDARSNTPLRADLVTLTPTR